MNKKEILRVLENYNLDKSNYIVISGASMVLQDVKEYTSDIDIAVSQEYFKYLLSNYECVFERVNEYGMEVYFTYDFINFSTAYYDSEYTLVNGIKVQSIESIIELKSKLNREKDKNDIKLLKLKLEKRCVNGYFDMF